MHFLRVLAFVFLFTAAPLLVIIVVQGPVDGEGDTAVGHWKKTANTDWCEANYVVTPYVAEIGNSLSSLTIVGNGVYGMVKHWNTVEHRYLFAFATFMLVGFGSALFHGTLMHEFQMLDELPMMWGNGVFSYVVITMEDKPGQFRKKYATFISVATLLMSVAVALFDSEDQTIFLVCYGSGVFFILFTSFRLDTKYNSTREVVLLETAVVFYVGGFTVWLLDRLYCKELIGGVIRVRSLYLHSFWHLGAGVGTFTILLFWIWTRGKVLKQKQKLVGVVPAMQWIAFDDATKVV